MKKLIKLVILTVIISQFGSCTPEALPIKNNQNDPMQLNQEYSGTGDQDDEIDDTKG